jgi:hypothetical protein
VVKDFEGARLIIDPNEQSRDERMWKPGKDERRERENAKARLKA